MSAVDTPLVSFVVPCYNSADYMSRCIEALLTASQPCEILVINDGSSDNTSAIAHEFAARDSRVIAIDQENANWGGVVNHGIALAKGTYFKIVDSDDFLDTEALYDRVTDKSQHTIQYRKLLPSGRVFKWSEMGHPGIDQFIMVHASWYRTQVLRDSGVKLPTGVSYMDSLFVLHPMPWVEKLYYLDVDTYHYIIGREGQSVEVEVVKKCIDQQLMATRLAIQDANYTQLYAEEPNRALLMMGYISCMMSVSTIYLFKINTPESLQKNRELWAFMKETDSTLYNNVKRTWAGLANRRTRIGRILAQAGYALAQKIFKFA